MKLTKKQLVALCQILLAVVAFCMLFVTCITFKYEGILVKTSKSFSGFEAYFGTEDGFKASAGGVLTVIFLAVIFVLAVLKLVLPKCSKLFNLVIILLAIAAAIFLFSTTTAFMVSVDSDALTVKDLNPSIGAGAIIGGIISILNACASVFDEFFIKK